MEGICLFLPKILEVNEVINVNDFQSILLAILPVILAGIGSIAVLALTIAKTQQKTIEDLESRINRLEQQR